MAAPDDALATFERRPTWRAAALTVAAMVAAAAPGGAADEVRDAAAHAATAVAVLNPDGVASLAGALVTTLPGLAAVAALLVALRRFGRCEVTAEQARFRPLWGRPGRPVLVVPLEAVRAVRRSWGGLILVAPDAVTAPLSWVVPPLVPLEEADVDRATALLCARRDEGEAAGSDAWFWRGALGIVLLLVPLGVATLFGAERGPAPGWLLGLLLLLTISGAVVWQDQRGRRVHVGPTSISVGHYAWRLDEVERAACDGRWFAVEGGGRRELAWVGPDGPRMQAALAARLAHRPGVVTPAHAPWVGRSVAAPYVVGVVAAALALLLGPGAAWAAA